MGDLWFRLAFTSFALLIAGIASVDRFYVKVILAVVLVVVFLIFLAYRWWHRRRWSMLSRYYKRENDGDE